MSVFRKAREPHNSKFFIREYKIIKQIGEGSYASIYKVQKDNSNEVYVLKQIPITEEELNDTQNLNDIKNESLILSKIHSPYIVKFYDSFFHKNCLNIITEFCSAGDLCDYLSMYINNKKKMNEKLIWKLFIQICLGLYYLHKHKILHRDIKTKNIFLNDDFSVKIGDLGIAKILENTSSYAHTFIGTPYYLSPELCKDLPYNDKSDVWSLGCVLYEMVTLKHPFEGKTKVEIYDKIINCNYEGIDKYYSLELRRIIDLLLIKDEKKRPKISDILSLNIIKEKARECGIKIPEIKNKNSGYRNNNNNNNNYSNNNNGNSHNHNNNSNNNSKNFNSNNNSKNNFNSNNNSNNYFGSNCSSGNYNNVNVSGSLNKGNSNNNNNQKKIKISAVEVNYFKYKNEKNNANKEKKQNLQLDNSGRNSSKVLDISSILKQSQDKIFNMLSKRKNNSKDNHNNKENKEIFNYNNLYTNNNNYKQEISESNNKYQKNLNKNNVINNNNYYNNQRINSGNITKRNYSNNQQYKKQEEINQEINNSNIYQNSKNETSEYYNSQNSNPNTKKNNSMKKNNNSNNSNNYNLNNNNNNIKENNNNHYNFYNINNKNNINIQFNELIKKNQIQMHNIINYNNNIKLQLNNNNNKQVKNLTESKENETNKSNDNSNNNNNEINTSLKNNNINISNGRGKSSKIPLVKNIDKSNVHDIILKMKNPNIQIKKNLNQPLNKNNNIKLEEKIIPKRKDSNNFTLIENKDMLLFNTNNSEKSNLKINEEKVKVFNANDTLINKSENQLKKDSFNLLNLKNKYLNLLNQSKNDMINISNNVFENVLNIYKKLDSNPDNIDIVYEEIQNYIKENITQNHPSDNSDLCKKFNRAFSNYVYYEIELKDIEKKIEKRKHNSKWYIN